MRGYNELSVAELKEILRSYGLSTTGVKVELIKRLNEYDPTSTRMNEMDKERVDEDMNTNTGPASEEGESTQSTADSGLPRENVPEWATREIELRRERDLLRRELHLSRREQEIRETEQPVGAKIDRQRQ
ncbi:PREDICTED: uncharacterized protein LOC105453030 [Wasmannia auropunctata]|uniref:uncharacterized protein LOC105453030 n=1 Tax=Wasmannia auropunctata TaxID=64793 RepID=UPI0005EEAE0D|nr:PREDICTED: uncharacterized protein LOC105453030 [Wasmannia auropunctata]